MDGTEMTGVPVPRTSRRPASGAGGGAGPAPGGLHLPRGVAQVRPEAPAAVLMVDLAARRVLYANEVAAQMAPGLVLPVSADEWSAAADLRDIDGEPLDETAHPLSRIARFEPVAGQGVSAARGSDLGRRREPLWVVALPLDDAPNLRGHALVVFLPVRDRDQLQERVEAAHARTGGSATGVRPPDADAALDSAGASPAPADEAAIREAAVLATGLSFTVAEAGSDAHDLPLVWVNPAFTAVTGYTFEAAVGRNCRFLQGPGTDRATTARMRTALEAGRSVTETLLNYRADGTAFWNQVAMSPIVDSTGRVTHYVGIQTDVSGRVAADAERDRALAAERAARAEAEAGHVRLQLLAEVTTQLSETTDAQRAMDRLARLVVPVLGDFAVLAVIGDDTTAAASSGGAGPGSSAVRNRHGLRDVAWWHHDPARLGLVAGLARTRLGSLAEGGREVLTSLLTSAAPTVHADPAGPAAAGRAPRAPVAEELASMMLPGEARESVLALAPTSMVTWPLRSRGRTLGLMTVATGPGRACVSADDLSLGTDIAARAGLALDRARLFRQQRDLAEGLQRSLLHLSPHAAPAHARVAVRYVAAAEVAQVGGDFYDVFTQPGGAGVVVIGDVMGHDTQAAAAMAQLRSIVRTFGVGGDDDPAAVLRRTDHMMRASGVDTTATATVARLGVPQDGQAVLEWSNAGHPPPLVIGVDGRVRLLEAPSTDLLLGVDASTDRRLTRTRLPVGAVLVLYTDGLVEQRDQPLSEGIVRLVQVAQEAARRTDDPEQLVDRVVAAMLPTPSPDDVAVVAVRLC